MKAKKPTVPKAKATPDKMNAASEKCPDYFSNLRGKTLVMCTASCVAILITHINNRRRKRTLTFVNEHAALDWCINRHTTFVLLPQSNLNEFN